VSSCLNKQPRIRNLSRDPGRHRRGIIGTIVFIVSLTACTHAPPSDPLARDRAALQALTALPLDSAFAPEARLVISRRLLAQELERALLEGLRVVADLELELPFVGPVSLRPTVEVDSVEAATGPASCTGCIALSVEVSGLLRPSVQNGASLPPVSWRGRVVGPFSLQTITLPDGRRELRALALTTKAADQGWSVDVQVDGFEGLAPTITKTVAQQLRKMVADPETPQIVLATLPKDVASQVRGLRPGADRGAVVVDLAFVAVGAGHVTLDAPVVEDGFALVVPEATLLAVANAAILKVPPRDGWTAALRALAVDDGAFVLDLDVWQLDTAPKRHEVRATGRITVDDNNGIAVVVDKADHRGDVGGFDPWNAVVRGEIVRRVEGALRQVGVTPSDLPDGRRLRLQRLVDHGDVLEVVGAVDSAPPR